MMRICIEKSTGKIIEMQSHATEGTLIANAVRNGHQELDLEEQEITETEYATAMAAQPKSPEEIQQALVAAVQNHLDAAARQYGYDDIKSAVTYAEEPAVPKFQAEGRAFRAWRSLTWVACYAILADVLAGTREVPTVDELLAELPALEPEV